MHPSADTGRVIAGRYRLQAPIGRGAMGVVGRPRDQLLDRDVAIKEVQIADTLTEAERATAFQRTLREAKTAARLNHPAVVTVWGGAGGGRPPGDREAAGPRAVAGPGAGGLGPAAAAAGRGDGPAAALRAERGARRGGPAPGRQA